MAKIAIVTPDIMGPIPNGGVGTAFYYLACLLAHQHDVTVYFAPEVSNPDQKFFEQWEKFYRGRNVSLRLIPPASAKLQGPPGGLRSYQVFLALEKSEFDFIHFPDMQGLGFFTCLARHQGVAFGKTSVCVHLHGSTLWHREGGGDTLRDLKEVEFNYLEQKSIEYADQIISPSQWMVKWVNEKGWRTKHPIQVIPHAPIPYLPEKEIKTSPREILFLGRFEDRKGFPEFVAALEFLPKDISVSFMGGPGEVQSEDGLSFLRRHEGQIRQKIDIISRKNHLETLQYLARHQPLVVMPSRCENSPCGVYECLNLQIPFLCTNVGGNFELVHPDDHAMVEIRRDPQAMAEKIQSALYSEQPPSRLHPAIQNSSKLWDSLHAHVPESPVIENDEQTLFPSLSVCIATKNRPHYLREALQSLELQTYKNFDVIVVDDGSNTEARLEYQRIVDDSSLKIQYFPLPSQGVSQARNQAVRSSQSELILFMDDDNLAKPQEIETLLRVRRRTGADILSSVLERFTDESENGRPSFWVPIGACLGLAPFSNIFGDTNLIISREHFWRVGGFSEKVDLGEDWDLLWRLCESGLKLEIIPTPLFYYRDHQTNRTHHLVRKQLGRISTPARRFMERLDSTCIDMARLAIGGRVSPAPAPFQKGREILQWDLHKFDPKMVLETQHLKFKKYKSGISIRAEQNDPFIVLDLRTLPIDNPRLEIRIHSDTPASLQVYTQTLEEVTYHESRVLHRHLPSGWSDHSVQIPGVGVKSLLRLDFGDSGGKFFIEEMRLFTEEISKPEIEFDYHIEHLGTLTPLDEVGIRWLKPEELELRNMQLIRSQDFEFSYMATNDDPQIRFAAGLQGSTVTTQLYIEIESNTETHLDVFYDYVGDAEFPPDQRIQIPLRPGNQFFHVSIYHQWPISQWRLDPGSAPGPYTLRRLGFDSSAP